VFYRVEIEHTSHLLVARFLLFFLQQPKFRANPCADKLMKLVNALEASEGKINGPVYKYVKDVEVCYKLANTEQSKKGRAGTLYYLSQYLDLGKFKK
jgi:hypothetical protein